MVAQIPYELPAPGPKAIQKVNFSQPYMGFVTQHLLAFVSICQPFMNFVLYLVSESAPDASPIVPGHSPLTWLYPQAFSARLTALHDTCTGHCRRGLSVCMAYPCALFLPHMSNHGIYREKRVYVHGRQGLYRAWDSHVAPIRPTRPNTPANAVSRWLAEGRP